MHQVERLDELPPTAAEDMLATRDEWIRVGLCTDPADRPAAEAAIRLMYRQGRLRAPKIVWCGSPMSMALTRAVMLQFGADTSFGDAARAVVRGEALGAVRVAVRDAVGPEILAEVADTVLDEVAAVDFVRSWIREAATAGGKDQFGAPVWSSVWDTVATAVRGWAGTSVWDASWTTVQASVRAAVLNSVQVQARDAVRFAAMDPDTGRHPFLAPVESSVWNSVLEAIYGQHDASWLAHYAQLRDWGLVQQTASLTGLWALARSAGWALPHERVCLVSERHTAVRRDGLNRLHCVDGPALLYPDGWAIYAIHGVRVPERVIMDPESMTPSKIFGTRNTEVRRVMIDLYGADRLMREVSAELVDDDETWGRLWRLPIDGDEPLVMVDVENSTPEPDGSRKRYMLRVPPQLRTAAAAVAWTFDLSADEYTTALVAQT